MSIFALGTKHAEKAPASAGHTVHPFSQCRQRAARLENRDELFTTLPPADLAQDFLLSQTQSRHQPALPDDCAQVIQGGLERNERNLCRRSDLDQVLDANRARDIEMIAA